MPNEPMILFNVGWMKRYKGIADDDQPQGGGAWVDEHGWDYSMLNFQEINGRHYGYGEARGAINVVRLGAEESADRLEGVTVVWVSTSPSLGPVIIGWYRNATLFRDYQPPPADSGREYNGEKIGYRTTARVEDCLLLPVERRTFSVPRGKGGMGQANVWYADSPENAEFRQRVMLYLKSGGKSGEPLARTWIFQANPKTYNIDAALQKLKEIGWEYGQAVRQFSEAYGLEKSAISEHFIEASREKLKAMMERRLDKTRLCALLIDATPFQGQQIVAALGISEDGRKTILGIRQGATENATVVGELLADLVDRGFDFTEPRLYVLDGGKALSAAVKKYAGESAAIQRCQVHKRRNVLDHLTEEQKSGVAKKLNAAYALEDYGDAKQALNALHRELMDLNPSAARSLGEGMEETLTVHRLRLPMQLRKTMASTNVIESAFSIVEQVCKNVKRWHGGDQRERWVGSGLLVAEKQFRRITGHKQIPALIRELDALTPSRQQVVKRKKAS